MPSLKERKERNKKILEIYRDYNLQELADMFGITREMVRLILKYNKIVVTRKERSNKRKTEKKILEKYDFGEKMQRGETSQLANEIGWYFIKKIKSRMNLGSSSIPIGCEDCKNHPYAKGLCRNCYTRQLRIKQKEIEKNRGIKNETL